MSTTSEVNEISKGYLSSVKWIFSFLGSGMPGSIGCNFIKSFCIGEEFELNFIGVQKSTMPNPGPSTKSQPQQAN
jgi:hypothetical protein